MRTAYYIIASLSFFMFSCENKVEQHLQYDLFIEKPVVEGLLPLTSEWQRDSAYYWTYNKTGNKRLDIRAIDTANYHSYYVTQVYSFEPSEGIKVSKHMEIDVRRKTILSEQDYYTRRFTRLLQTHMDISYDYLEKTYEAQIVDSASTAEMMRIYDVKLDSITAYAEANGYKLCGSGIEEILKDYDLVFSTPRKIKKQEAVEIAKVWMKKD